MQPPACEPGRIEGPGCWVRQAETFSEAWVGHRSMYRWWTCDWASPLDIIVSTGVFTTWAFSLLKRCRRDPTYCDATLLMPYSILRKCAPQVCLARESALGLCLSSSTSKQGDLETCRYDLVASLQSWVNRTLGSSIVYLSGTLMPLTGTRGFREPTRLRSRDIKLKGMPLSSGGTMEAWAFLDLRHTHAVPAMHKVIDI